VYNRSAEQMFGYSAVEMYGKSLLTLVPPSLCEGNSLLQNYFSNTSKGNAQQKRKITVRTTQFDCQRDESSTQRWNYISH
jgi:PAS domain S-box-containing protein